MDARAGPSTLAPRLPDHLRRPLLLTRWGLAAERLLRAFWPLWTILALTLAALTTGWQDELPLEALWALTVAVGLGALAALGWGLWRLRWPSRDEAVARLDATLPGRPLAAIVDAQAVGAADPASRAVWEAHLARMAARARDARAPSPDLRLASRDPYGLRYVALILLLAGLLFGQAFRAVEGPAVLTGPNGATLAQGPLWEGWIAPPAYTGRPQLYLADLPPGPIDVPVGSTITLRLYGEVGALAVEETVSGRTGDLGAATDGSQEFAVTRSGTLAIDGPGGARWEVTALPDHPPAVAPAGPVEVDAQGEMAQPFEASDDFGVASGTATIALDLAAVDRAWGLAAEPDPREPLVLDLPMPFSGGREAVAESLVENLSQHPFANLPVTLTFEVTDAAGQTGASEPVAMTLPGRRFFQPVARAVVEQRRDLLWARENAPRVVQVLRAVANRPETLFTDESTYLRLNFTIRRLAALDPVAMTEEERDGIAQALWDLAVQLEDGTLADARERLERAQERLAEAMRNGASPEEIAELMQELREATDDYLSMLAQNAQPGEEQTDQPQSAQNQNQEVTQDQIQAMMDRIQELMEEGRMAEAQQLMEELNQLMENIQVTEGQQGSGNGPRSPGQQSMQDLQESLRDQQDLSDEAFRDLQEQFGQQGQPGQEGQQGQDGQQGQQGQDGQQGQQQPGQGPGGPQGQPGQPGQQPGQEQGQGSRQGEGQDGQGGRGGQDQGSLADRQQALRDEIARQRSELPGLTGDAAEAARDALGRAEDAMDGAEDALRDGDLSGAIDQQAQAMDALREGMRNLGQALAENGRIDPEPQGQAQGETQGRPVPGRRDPLGRQLGQGGESGTDQQMTEGEDVYRRAEELLAEIRRRAAEQERPKLELDYLKRLLERF